MIAAPFPEDSYGRVRRLEFVAAAMPTEDGAAVLDVGCGTGSQLTRPLADLFPHVRVHGVDSDARSIQQAQAHVALPNLSFSDGESLNPEARFAMVIASEVLEHVDDPHGFLVWLRSRLAPGGRLVITVPNGWGASELCSVVECLLTLSGVWPALRLLKRRWFGGGAEDDGADTLAVSPHVNFFTRPELLELFADSGFSVRRFGTRALICGFLLDQVVAKLKLADWSARITERLPPCVASDWMFELTPAHAPQVSAWRRGMVAQWRRSLNLRRWGLSP